MRFGKMNGDVFEEFNGRYIRYDGRVYANPSEERLISAGYKPVVEEEFPEIKDGYDIATVYTETEDGIVEGYEYVAAEVVE